MHEYPLSGILFCADCGHKYRGGLNTSNHKDGTKKELLQCVFKEILIKDKKIVSISFYRPFARYCKELKCVLTQVVAESSKNPYLLRPTAGRWVQYVTSLIEFLEKIFYV